MAVAAANKIVRGDDLTTVAGEIDKHFQRKVNGKGLSTNDYTTEEKTKLAGIAAGAEVNVNADWNAASGDAQILNKPTIPTKTSDLTNDSGFITASDVPAGVQPATVAPLRDGTAAVGSSAKYAKEDHVHPTDTSRAPIDNPVFNTSVAIANSQQQQIMLIDVDEDNGNPEIFTSKGTLQFNATSLGDSLAIITKSGTIAMTSDITTAISGKADSATTLAGYGITDAYTKTQVDTAIANALKGGYVVVNPLPTASAETLGKIYLVPMTDTEDSNVKEEYVTWLDGSTYKWEKLGTTQFDNSDYEERLTVAEIKTLLNL